MMSVTHGQLSSLVALAFVAVMAASWPRSTGAEFIYDLAESSRHHLPYDSLKDPRESGWDEGLSDEKRSRSQSWRLPPSEWSAANKRYMRFGRSNTDDPEDVDSFYPSEEEKRYMRFGKRYMRFGRRVGPIRGHEVL